MNAFQPPKWMMTFFRWFCREDLCDAVEGDLLAVYQTKRQRNKWRADFWYFRNVITFLQPFALKRRPRSPVFGKFHLVQVHFCDSFVLPIPVRFLKLHSLSPTRETLFFCSPEVSEVEKSGLQETSLGIRKNARKRGEKEERGTENMDLRWNTFLYRHL